MIVLSFRGDGDQSLFRKESIAQGRAMIYLKLPKSEDRWDKAGIPYSFPFASCTFLLSPTAPHTMLTPRGPVSSWQGLLGSGSPGDTFAQ